jgi:AAA domain
MFTVRKAEKRKAKLRLALVGVGGSGKSIGAINIAIGMNKKFVVIDTENTSADLYASIGDFDVLELEKPYTPERYISAIQHCEKLGYGLIIIDSLSHAWSGEGGALDMHTKETEASRSKNSYMAWGKITPLHNRLINTMLQSACDIIVTMRAKTHYEIIDDGGRKRPVKLGLAPVQREGMDYEFTTVLDIDKDTHLYTCSKDRTQLFDGKHEKLSQETGKKLIEWLNDGKDVEQEQQEDVERIKKIMMSSTLEGLRKEYSSAKNKYPHLEKEFLKIANERKSVIESEIH